MTRARATLEMLLADVEASLAHNRARWKGGQQAGNGGPLAAAGPSALFYLRREIKRGLEE